VGFPPGSAPASASGGGKRWLVTVAVAVVVLLAAGITSYVVSSSYARTAVSQSCDIYKCIPRLKAESVVTALKDRGYTCTTDANHETCELQIGAFYFDASLQVSEGLITRINLRVYREASAPLTPGSVAFLKWFGALPYRDDPVLAAEIEAWVDQQVEATKDAKAVIGDYEYSLTNPEPHSVLFEIKGTYS